MVLMHEHFRSTKEDGETTMEMRPLHLGMHGAHIERSLDGRMILSSKDPLAPYARRYTERLEHWARSAGDRIFLAQRTTDGTGWRTITYRDTFDKVQYIAQALLDRGLSAERPLMILSGNEIEHALIALAALHVGIPYSPISVSYSLVSKDHAKLRHCFELLTPGLVYVSDAAAFKCAIDAVIPVDVEIVCRERPLDGRRMTSFDTLLDATPTSAVDAAAAEVCGETPARILFTSGSTAMPKGAINTHQTACANMQVVAQVWPFTIDEPPVVCDWLPWNHTSGGGLIGLIIHAGESLYIADGRPMSGQIEKTVRNLNEVRPTIFISVPASFELLLPYLESDDTFRVNFFSRLKMLYYSAASPPDETSDRYRIFTASGYGATEVGPLALVCNWDTPRKGVIGLPLPGFQVKLIPNGQKLEIRAKGPAIVPGYFRQPELTAQGTTGSNRIVRMRVSDVPLTDVEVTDKNTISTNVVNDRRREEIEDLYSFRPSCRVFIAETETHV